MRRADRPRPNLDPNAAKDRRFAVVVSRFNEEITSRLRDSAARTLLEFGALKSDIEVIEVPGAFEIPFAAQKAAESGRFDAIVCLGCVIRGETPHFDYICQWVAHGVGQVGLTGSIPATFGVITADTLGQAIARSSDNDANKGVEAAQTAVEMALLTRRLKLER